MSDMTWPDTVGQDPPADHLYLSATWLLGRYPQLARLVERVPGVVEIGEDGVGVDVGVLAEAIAGQARAAAEWLEYRSKHQPPEEEGEAYIAWEAGGPPTSAGAEAVNAMSHPERTWLRLLATFAATGVTLTVADLQSLDAVGHEFLADWCSAVQTVQPRSARRTNNQQLSPQRLGEFGWSPRPGGTAPGLVAPGRGRRRQAPVL